jgi:hypothetical protein
MVGDFHALDRFGELVFADAAGNLPAPPPMSPVARMLPIRPMPKVGLAPVSVAAPDRKARAAKRGEASGSADPK